MLFQNESIPQNDFEQAADFYHSTGYYIFDPEISEKNLNGALKDTLNKFKYWKPGGPYHVDRVQDAWRYSRHVRHIALAPKTMKLLEVIYNRKPRPFQTLNFPVGTEQPTHSDTIHFNSSPAGLMCGVWVALEDIDMSNGPLIFYPGTQVFPEYRLEHLGLEADPKNYKQYEAFIQRSIESLGLKCKHGTIKKGMAIIWSANLWHGGLIQHDKSRTRHSQVTHYFFGDSDFHYIPILSTKEKIHYKKPRWIV